MKTNIYTYLLSLFTCIFICSCSEDLTTPIYDMGSKTYEEPFVGLLKSKPSILEKSLKYPPFSWFVSDTVSFKKNFEVTFNEECLRSKTEVTFYMTDSLNQIYKGATIFYNGKEIENGRFTLAADSSVKNICLEYVLPPQLGDYTSIGNIQITAKELDKVNGLDLTQESKIIGIWKCEQEISWPIMIWLLWLLVLLLFFSIIFFIIYATIVIIPLLSMPVESSLPFMDLLIIRWKSGWSTNILRYIRTKEEAKIYMKAKLKEKIINGKTALIQPQIDGRAYNAPQWPDWSNKDLAEEGYAPRDTNGIPYELHHIGQNPDSPLAELTWEEHHANGNFKKLHTFDESIIDRCDFEIIKKNYWIARAYTFN